MALRGPSLNILINIFWCNRKINIDEGGRWNCPFLCSLYIRFTRMRIRIRSGFIFSLRRGSGSYIWLWFVSGSGFLCGSLSKWCESATPASNKPPRIHGKLYGSRLSLHGSIVSRHSFIVSLDGSVASLCSYKLSRLLFNLMRIRVLLFTLMRIWLRLFFTLMYCSGFATII